MKKKFAMGFLTAAMTAAMGITAFAGQWVEDDEGWRWYYDNGSYAENTWLWIDGNQDGVSECYYLGPVGYMFYEGSYPNGTPDGYTVNYDGQWTVNGVVQTRTANSQPGTTGTQSGNASADFYNRENWTGTYRDDDGDEIEIGLGASGALAVIYYDNDGGDTKIYNFDKVTDSTYKASSKAKTLTLNSDGTVTFNNSVFSA